jgi:hypothetical protein
MHDFTELRRRSRAGTPKQSFVGRPANRVANDAGQRRAEGRRSGIASLYLSNDRKSKRKGAPNHVVRNPA